jgi:hypothetical protein
VCSSDLYVDATGLPRVSRALISFSNNKIQEVISNKVTGEYACSLKIFLAEASELPTNLRVEGYSIGEAWVEGIGKYGDTPIDNTGASWWAPTGNSNISWSSVGSVPTFSLYVNPSYVVSGYIYADSNTLGSSEITGSYITSQPGGGSWFTNQNSLNTFQDLERRKDLDLNVNVLTYISNIVDNNIQSNGILLKLNDDFEFTNDYNIRLRYFSADTNTIYSPCLEVKWKDIQYVTGSISVIPSANFEASLDNNRSMYDTQEEINFRINCRPKYPVRTFTTSSVYLTNYALPPTAMWSIVDEFTNERVIDFDNEFTLVGCDSNGPYFKVFMNTLSPERFYRIEIKTVMQNSTTVKQLGTFKVKSNE